MKKQYFLGMLIGIVMTGCSGNRTNGNADSAIAAETEPVSETVELTPCDITIGEVKFAKAKNQRAGTITVSNDTMRFVAGPQTDYFRSTYGSVVNSSPVIFTEIDNTKPFTFTAKVNPKFTETGTYSAGVLYAYENDFPETILLGISSQSPKDDEHTCYFSEVSLVDVATSDFRNGKLANE